MSTNHIPVGKQLKSLRPQPEQIGPPHRHSESCSEDELGTKKNAVDRGYSPHNWVNEVPRFKESPKCTSDSETSDVMVSPSQVGSRLSRLGSSGNPTPWKPSIGISRFFSSKAGY
ncbi:unnamed protein product [Microthlaspi erraticum]|uniref:Uncharacterized protein n=1 Tax=Microthlaspi erraticum TaxID=1685480 RepID=A0A6D2L631_9BRAS|nr:unnamed protein product [Microthlaspi erraticum]CAA7060276.1 unnamed protein product [Microthlaspi erraticum]